MEKKVSFSSKKKEGSYMFGLCFVEDILRGGKTHVHSCGICLYMNIIVKLFVL